MFDGIIMRNRYYSNKSNCHSWYHIAIIYYVYKIYNRSESTTCQSLSISRQFHLIVCYKPIKEHIITNAPSRLASTNNSGHHHKYPKFDTFFVLHMILVQINPDPVKKILDDYTSDKL